MNHQIENEVPNKHLTRNLHHLYKELVEVQRVQVRSVNHVSICKCIQTEETNPGEREREIEKQDDLVKLKQTLVRAEV